MVVQSATPTRDQTASVRRWRLSLPRMAVLSLVLTTGISAAPVASRPVQVTPHPVHPRVSQFLVKGLTSTRAEAANSARSTPNATVELVTADGHGSLVGVTWPAGAAPSPGTSIQVRGLGESGWTPWTSTEVTADEDAAAVAASRQVRVGTEPVWLGPVTKVQVRYPASAASQIRAGRLEVVEPGTSPADEPAAPPPGSAQAATAKPTVISRARWGADESLRTCSPSYASTTLAMVVHHTAGTNNYTAKESASIVRGIYAYHAKGQGWCDIGYNALVDKYGQVFEGRYGGLDLPVIGAHTGGFNTDTFGVSVLGTYTSSAPSSSAVAAVTNVLAWRAASFYRDAKSTSVLTSRSSDSKYKAGTRVTVPFIIGHRDLWSTSCPGTAFYNTLGSVRNTVASKTTFTSSPIYKRWAALGGAKSGLGPVLKGEGAVSFGRRTVFQKRWAMYSVGSSTRLVGPGIDAMYWRSGGPAVWGAPLADEAAIPGGSMVSFQDGHVGVWSSATGTQPLFGAIKKLWLAPGPGKSPLGYPRAPEALDRTGGVVQEFELGNAYYRYGAGAHAVVGHVLKAYLDAGGPAGRYGYPTSERVQTSTGWSQTFQGGTITTPRGADDWEPIGGTVRPR